MLLIGLLCARLAAAAPLPAPPAFEPVLARHALDADHLRARGFAFQDGRCYRLDPLGNKIDPALSPEDLDAALGLARAGAAPAKTEPSAPPLALKSDDALRSLRSIYDAAASAAASAAIPVAPPPPALPAPKPPYAEPAFDPSWAAIAVGLRDPKGRGRALRALSARFAEAEDSATGLSADAPEALRLLADALQDGVSIPGAESELHRELALVANLEPAEKTAFAASLQSPLVVYVALSRSHASHALDSQLYFRRMARLLEADGRSLTGFIADVDPAGKYAGEFLLRAHAYDALLPYLKTHPSEAGSIVPFLFPDGKPGTIRARAARLEGLITQLGAQGKASGALSSFFNGLEAWAAESDEGTAARIALFVKVNEPILPKKFKTRVDVLAAGLPAGLLEDSGLAPADPKEFWPAENWTFVLQFANPSSYDGWRKRFLARGYAVAPDAGGEALVKVFGGVTVRLVARLYPGDEEGFMHDEVAKQFLSDVARDLRDPAIQGVILRNHAQFNIGRLFGKGVTKHKLVLDGACRSAWDLQALRRSCPTCSFIVNTGTGQGHVNNDAVAAVVEGLANGEAWDEIGSEWARLSPAAARIQGPWTPPYAEALKLLEKAENDKMRRP